MASATVLTCEYMAHGQPDDFLWRAHCLGLSPDSQSHSRPNPTEWEARRPIDDVQQAVLHFILRGSQPLLIHPALLAGSL